jgi:hypothetical protein
MKWSHKYGDNSTRLVVLDPDGVTWNHVVGDALGNIGGEYKIIVDDISSSDYIYFGKADVGSDTSDAVWQVKKFTIATGIFTHADGNASFDNVWDNRASLTYS